LPLSLRRNNASARPADAGADASREESRPANPKKGGLRAAVCDPGSVGVEHRSASYGAGLRRGQARPSPCGKGEGEPDDARPRRSVCASYCGRSGCRWSRCRFLGATRNRDDDMDIGQAKRSRGRSTSARAAWRRGRRLKRPWWAVVSRPLLPSAVRSAGSARGRIPSAVRGRWARRSRGRWWPRPRPRSCRGS
jgi:hypothetical protein